MVETMAEGKGAKIYVLDTNVLVHDPHAMLSFADVMVGIPAIVLEQLDEFKKEGSARGRNTREAIRILDGLRSRGSLKDGVKLDNGGTLKVIFLNSFPSASFPFKIRIEDNEILMTTALLQQKGYQVTFISKDLNARVKADTLGIATEDYLKEHVSEDEFYHGWRRVPVPAVQLGKEAPDELVALAKEEQLSVNEFVIAESRHNPFNYRVYRHKGGGSFKVISDPTFPWPFKARNPQQLMALDLLLDPTIELVTLFGPAGTGKTFLSLLTGLFQVMVQHDYEKILISRPVVPLGRDIGYLPGTMEEKLHSWMLPVFDNMEFIAHAARTGRHLESIHEEAISKPKQGRRYRPESEQAVPLSLDELMRRDKVSLEAITYMRGRSIPYQFILIDEVQNLTPHEVKTIISRVGEGSKMVLTGDPYQIDSPYLDFASNGLVVASERFRGQEVFGSVYLETSERSKLSQLANDLL
jgi:PhoH-like ATPase